MGHNVITENPTKHSSDCVRVYIELLTLLASCAHIRCECNDYHYAFLWGELLVLYMLIRNN